MQIFINKLSSVFIVYLDSNSVKSETNIASVNTYSNDKAELNK